MELKVFEKLKDISQMSEQERDEYIELLKSEAEICNLTQEVAKLCLNSIYGALGNEFFHFYKTELAEAITLQGQDAIKFSERLINDYFKNIFPTDYELLEKLGISKDFKVKPIESQGVSIYCHTDSQIFNTQHFIKEKFIEVETDEGLLKYYINQIVNIKRNETILSVFAKDLLEGDEIL